MKKRLVIEMDEDLRLDFRLYCLARKTTMKDQVLEWIQEALTKSQKGGK